jgi:hypothetical protein
VIAIEDGEKNRAHRVLTDAYQLLQKPALLQGHSRVYKPNNDEDIDCPADDTALVQVRCQDVTLDVTKALIKLFDITATKEWANQSARSDVVVDGKTILKAVPVTYLLFLEKQLTGLHTYVSKLPILDPAYNWTYDPQAGCYRTASVPTIRNRKVKRHEVVIPPTEHHPGQFVTWEEDMPVGTWSKTLFAGGMQRDRVRQLTDRIEKLQRSVKLARENANSIEAPEKSVGVDIFAFLFED